MRPNGSVVERVSFLGGINLGMRSGLEGLMRRDWMSVVRVACVFGVVAVLGVGSACSDDPKSADAVDTVDTQADAVDSVEPEVDAVEDGAGDAAEVEVVEKPGLGIDYGTTAAGAMPRFDLGAEDWMSVGWPSDRYRVDGHLKLTNMPQNVADLQIGRAHV